MSTNDVSQGLTNFFASKTIAKDYLIAERATGPPARALLLQAGLLSESVLSDSEYTILDNACGAGVVTLALYEMFKGKEGQLKVVCGDFSARMVESVKERIVSLEGLKAEVRELDAQALDIPSNHFTHVLTNFGFQSFRDSLLGLRESVRVTKPGGTIGLTTWVNPGWVPALRIAASRIPGAPRTLPDPLPFMVQSGRWLDASWIRQQLEEIPEVDPATIRIEEHSFVVTLDSEEAVRKSVNFVAGLLNIFMTQWSLEEQEACKDGKLLEAVVQVMIEEPHSVWRSLITTAQKM